MRCISRIVDKTNSQKFGDGYHIFYLEQRCTVVSNSEICILCSSKSETKTQYSRRFNHGTIHDPIPDISHIYGSKWYYESVAKYTIPSKDVIEFAEKYKANAHSLQPVKEPVKSITKKPIIVESLPVHKEVSIPTHIETSLEELDIEEFTVEHVLLTKIEFNGNTYFKDNKNKLYKNIKESIGPYVGRLHNDSIINIPDSDDEN